MNRSLEVARAEGLDPHYVNRLARFEAALARRSVLDRRIRLLVRVGQFTVTRNPARLEDALSAALDEGLAQAALEVIFQCSVYSGDQGVGAALEIFVRLARREGQLDAVRSAALPVEGPDRGTMESEQPGWDPQDQADPRRQSLMQRYGWSGISTGLRLRPRHHLNILEYLDAIDQDFARSWLEFIYDGMYVRGVLDDRTRLLCLVGELSALGETTQLREHMRGALRCGASVEQLKEVVLQTCLDFGMPYMLRSLALLVSVLEEDGRLAEIGSPPRAVQ
ncbi:MAG TPA: carboxymuconolactone decarboxylase family protein [Candidatus Nitrosotalea sp.]|nr:carboxymuconolactone decarboxylase family protein [Candidatus Nitrosotalea sp.]